MGSLTSMTICILIVLFVVLPAVFMVGLMFGSRMESDKNSAN